MAKYKRIVDTTTNSRIYNLALKRYRELQCIISCSRCKYNRNENQRTYYRKNWKHYRKTQYKVIMYDEYGE